MKKSMLLVSLMIVSWTPFVLSVCNYSDTAAVESEKTSHGVKLKLYRLSVTGLNDVIEKFTAQISAKATTYCASNAGTCGLTAYDGTSPFKDFHVVTVSGPEAVLKDVEVTFALELPSTTYNDSTGSPNCVVTKAGLQDIVGNAREDIHSDTGFWITYVDTEFYGIPPPTKLNQIIIPIAFAVLLGIILTAVILNVWSKKKEAAIRRKKIIEQRQKKQKESTLNPVYNLPSGDTKVPDGIDGKKEKPKRKDELYRDNLRNRSAAPKKTESVLSEDSAIKLDSEPRQKQAFAYEKKLDGATGNASDIGGNQYGHLAPIENPDNEEMKEKKKKKKKKSLEVSNFPSLMWIPGKVMKHRKIKVERTNGRDDQ